MKVWTKTNVAGTLFPASSNVTLKTILVDEEGNQTVSSESDSNYDHKGTVISVDGVEIVHSSDTELLVHSDVTEVKTLDDGLEYQCLKGTTIKVADFVPGKYTYNGSAWGTV